METKVNGFVPYSAGSTSVVSTNGNGHVENVVMHNGNDEPSIEELQSELPQVEEGQIPLRELLQRTVQAIYAELTEMAETLPGMSDAARKRTIADWVVKTKKQVVKLYAVMRWARDAEDVQKAMNITAFLMDQNQQFEESIHNITFTRESLAPARLRNHDLLTALDVLTHGTYLRLPSQIKKFFITPPKLSDDDVGKTLAEMEECIRYKLKTDELIPVEMSQYRVEDGRAFFTVPNKFEVSLSLLGAQKDDGWFFVHVKFLHSVGGDLNDVQEFPATPTGDLKQHITTEADSRLQYYHSKPPDPKPAPNFEPPPTPQLPAGTVDAPLVRLFNFLQMMSLTYQLEILFFQAQRLRSLGWRDFMSLEKSRDGKSFTATYWLRPQMNGPGRPQGIQRMQIPDTGGKISISLVETRVSAKAGGGCRRTPKDRILAKLEQSAKLLDAYPSDDIETFYFEVKWEPTKGALGTNIPSEFLQLDSKEFQVNATHLDFEALLRKAIQQHVQAILTTYLHALDFGPYRTLFSFPGEVILQNEDDFCSLRMHLCADEYINVSVDTRTGRITLRDTGSLSASGRAARYSIITDRINENPAMVCDVLVQARFSTIIELAEQKAQYMGLQTFKTRNLSREELAKFGPDIRALLYIQLASFRKNYLVILVTELEFRFALVSLRDIPDSPTYSLMIEDIGWLDVQRIHGDEVLVRAKDNTPGAQPGTQRGSLGSFGHFDLKLGTDRFKLETEVLRELYSYCCARVAYTRIETQLKLRNIPYTYLGAPSSSTNFHHLAPLLSSLTRSVPSLSVQSSTILAGSPAAEAAMPNVRIMPLNWWSNKKLRVVTSVKLKYVQQPMGKRAGSNSVIRPSRRIIYDSREAIVSFLSDDVDTCLSEFLEEWAKVSKIVVIAREIVEMAKRKAWDDVRLLSFDLQTVEFVYAKDYSVSITCTDQLLLSSSGSYELRFSRIRKLGRTNTLLVPGQAPEDDDNYNPHEEAEPYLRHVLRQGPQLAASINQLMTLLRDSLPLACAVDSLRRETEAEATKKAGAPDMLGLDFYVKATGWYRIIYGDSRHALDLRLMKGRRVAIVDANIPLVTRLSPGATPSPSKAPKSSMNSKLGSVTTKDGGKAPTATTLSTAGILLPIPGFAEIVRTAASDVLKIGDAPEGIIDLSPSGTPLSTAAVATSSTAPYVAAAVGSHHGIGASSASHNLYEHRQQRRIVQLDTGMICDVEIVDLCVSRVHAEIMKMLRSSSTSAQATASTPTGRLHPAPGG